MNIQDAPASDVLAKYKSLIYSFINHEISAPDFEDSYLRVFKAETESFGQEVFDILQQLFRKVDGYVADPELREELLRSNPELRQYSQGLDDGELRDAAREAYTQLFA
jgi:Bacterial self-protective colicin-like immunity